MTEALKAALQFYAPGGEAEKNAQIIYEAAQKQLEEDDAS